MARGALKLPADVEIHSGKWITRLNRHIPSRRQLLNELVSDQLHVFDRLTSTGKRLVTRVSGHRDLVESDEVSVADWFRIMAYEETLKDPSHSIAKEALKSLELLPGKACAAAASRLVRLYRVTISDLSGPHASENIHFWRYVSVQALLDL